MDAFCIVGDVIRDVLSIQEKVYRFVLLAVNSKPVSES